MLLTNTKKKSNLEIATEEVQTLVHQTNLKINTLGVHNQWLHEALTNIQNLFDTIRNVPSDTMQEYQEIKKVCMDWKQQVDKIYNDYNTVQNVSQGLGGAGTLLGAGVAVLGPSAAMGIATTFGVASTGTAISTLSGAAATNAALAWLGGGALAAGGGGMAAGSAILSLAGPVGWAIAGTMLLGSGIVYFMSKYEQKKLEDIYLSINKQKMHNYQLAIVEINERQNKIHKETRQLYTASYKIENFGTMDYNQMTEEQQHELGTYVNLMLAATQSLVNPILGLQPKVSLQDLEEFKSSKDLTIEMGNHYNFHKNLVVYLANLLYKVEIPESDLQLLSKSFGRNKDLLKQLELEKKDFDIALFNLVNELLRFCYSKENHVTA